ncbi:MAG: hypothetical protein M3401_13470 [Actinomycetota bacterium]|nr:hypothetical protein [Actinomycetota bacterium]
MAHGEPRAWWADVQHLRSDYERTDEARRRADQADLAVPRRRTVEIRGRTVPAPPVPHGVEFDRAVDLPRRRPARPPAERMGAHPDRMALWALVMGVMLILVAVSTADAATVGAIAGR